jgi:protein CpxP
MSFTKSLIGALSLILVLSAMVFAQQPQTSPGEDGATQRKMRPREGRGPGHRGRGGFGMLRRLDLTDEQRAQHREIVERHMANTKGQRDELAQLRQKRAAGTLTPEDEARAQSLREEIQNSMQGIRAELNSILTPEQQAKLQELESQRRSRMGERMKGREKFKTTPQ